MRKIISIVCCTIICIIISGCGKKEDYAKLNDEEFLTNINIWQYLDAPNIKYTLNKDKTGTYTMNKEYARQFTWELIKGSLYLEFGEDDEEIYDYSLDKKNVSLTLIQDGMKKIFVKDGYIKEASIGTKQDKSIKGIWQSDDTILVLSDSTSGYGYATNEIVFINNEIEWSASKDTFEFINSAGVKKTYEYKISKNKLTLYVNGKKARIYTKVNKKLKIQKV